MLMTILPHKAATIFIGLNIVTVLSFNDPVKTYTYGGSRDDLFVEKVNSDKTLIIKPREKGIKSNFLVITDAGPYSFYLEEDAKPHDFINVSYATIDSTFVKARETNDFEIWEGKSSTRFLNKKKAPVFVNGEKVLSLTYLGKGVPVIVDGVRVFN